MKTRDKIMKAMETPQHHVDEDKECWLARQLTVEVLLDIRDQNAQILDCLAELPTHQQIEIHSTNIHAELQGIDMRLQK